MRVPTLWTSLILAALLFPLISATQPRPDASPETDVRSAMDAFHAALNRADAAAAEALIHPSARLVTTMRGAEGGAFGSVAEYVSAFVEPPTIFHELRFAEDPQVLVSDALAVVWADYTYLRQGQVYFCGTEAVQLVRSAEGWRIMAMAHSVQQRGCEARASDPSR